MRFILEMACHALFVDNMFLDSSDSTIETFNPEIIVFHAPLMNADNGEYGLRSGTAVEINLDKRIVVIVGTLYSGEIKKSVFSFLNYILPKRSVLPMHCSANVGFDGDTALFFGLSGTGKTTLVSYLLTQLDLNLTFSISTCSRKKRDLEKLAIKTKNQEKLENIPSN